ncbi:MAG: hypothetical protein HC860_16255 [Alkalinema sp. RU_4_3]|nr:hypothetical protein [Alkalinema sp. RU_4_3]
MILIAILAGIILGQYIRLDVNPKALDVARTLWAKLAAIDIKGAIEYARMGPLQRKVHDVFEQLDAEAIAAIEPTEKTPKAIAARTAKQPI